MFRWGFGELKGRTPKSGESTYTTPTIGNSKKTKVFFTLVHNR